MILRRVVFVELLQRCDFTFSLEGTISLLSREYVQSKQGIGVVFSLVGTGNNTSVTAFCWLECPSGEVKAYILP